MRRAAMALPMAPSPATPICIRHSPDASIPAPTLGDQYAARKRLAPPASRCHSVASRAKRDREVNGERMASERNKKEVSSASSASASWAAHLRKTLSPPAGASSVTTSTPARRRAMARAGVEIAADAGDVARKARNIITSLPSPARAGRDGRRHRQGRRAAPRRRRSVDLHDRGQGEGRGSLAQGRPCHARLPDQRHRRAGQDQGHRDLCLRRLRRDQAAAADVRSLQPRRVRSRRIRQRQPDEIRRQSSCRHQQRGERGSDGAWA